MNESNSCVSQDNLTGCSSPRPDDIAAEESNDLQLKKWLSPSKEIIPLYFNYVESLQFDQAIEILSNAINDSEYNWKLFTHLQLLAVCDSIYYSMMYLTFTDKNYLARLYAEVSHALLNTDEQMNLLRTDTTSRGNTDLEASIQTYTCITISYFSKLFKELTYVIEIKTKFISCFYTLFDEDHIHLSQIKQICRILESALQLITVKVSHPLLLQIKHYTIGTAIALLRILQIETGILEHNYEKTIFYLCLLETELKTWKCKFTFFIDKQKLQPFFHVTMYRLFLLLKDYLYSKARIFFQQLEFSKTGYKWVKKLSGNDFDCSVSFDSQIIAFIESSQCLNVSLILEPPLNETAQGMHSWPAIYTYPQMQAPVQHWPNIISLLQDQCHYIYDSYSPETDNNSAGNVSNGVHTLYYYDSLVQITYYLTHIQERVVLSILYANKKEQGDLLTKQFTEKFCSWLKYTHVFWKALSKCT